LLINDFDDLAGVDGLIGGCFPVGPFVFDSSEIVVRLNFLGYLDFFSDIFVLNIVNIAELFALEPLGENISEGKSGEAEMKRGRKSIGMRGLEEGLSK
jgi:hypothetical protein